MSEQEVSTSTDDKITETSNTVTSYNLVALLFKLIGISILIISIWLGYLCFETRDILQNIFKSYEIPLFSLMFTIGVSLFSLILGLFLYGFGEVVQKLHEINQKL